MKVSLDDSVETHFRNYKEKFKEQAYIQDMNSTDSITQDIITFFYFGCLDIRISSCLNAYLIVF